MHVSSGHLSKLRDSVPCELQIFVKDVRDLQGKKIPIAVRTWSTIKDVKDRLQQLLHVPPGSQRLYFGPLLTSGKELPNYRSLHDAGIYRSDECLFLDIVGNMGCNQISISSLSASALSDICIMPSVLDKAPRRVRRIVEEARRSFAVGIKPVLVPDGSGGTYFLHNTRKAPVGVFKPSDEEPYAVNNPRGYVQQGDGFDQDPGGLREGIQPGESCIREVAAYLLDHKGFSNVPATTLVSARHQGFNSNSSALAERVSAVGEHLLGSTPLQPMKKVGSCQEFIRAECSMDDMSYSKLSDYEVQKIAILDIRLLNADRNGANLLVRRKPNNALELVPIDHGYCLRASADVAWFDWCWLDWPQVKKPLSKDIKDYVLNLDIEADARFLLQSLQIGEDALDYFRVSSKILKTCVKSGLRLYDIATMCCRQDSSGSEQSKLEKICSQARELATYAIENGRWDHTAASDALRNHLAESNPKFNRISLPSLINDDFTGGITLPSVEPLTLSSDSSSDTGDQPIDCEDWAANIVAKVNLMKHEKVRSLSTSSSGSISSRDMPLNGPLGFWVVRPGADVDDDSWSTSSASSPTRMSVLSTFEQFNDSKLSVFSEEDDVFQLLPPVAITPQKSPPKRLVRSQSCNSFPFKTQDFNTVSPSESKRIQKQGVRSMQFKIHFFKFIDLLIEREVAASMKS